MAELVKKQEQLGMEKIKLNDNRNKLTTLNEKIAALEGDYEALIKRQKYELDAVQKIER